LVKEIREIIGNEIPISLTLDPHANNTMELTDYVNIIRSYRTVPHVDQPETEKITALLLVENIKENTKIKTAFERLPMIIGGNEGLGSMEPLKSIFEKLEEVEEQEGIATASFFIGFSWADTENSAPSVIVVPKSEQYSKLAKEKVKEISDYVYTKKDDFGFGVPALKPEKAIQTALESELKPVFITDSGDNTTGGAVGTYTYFLELLLKKNLGNKKVCLTSVLDKEAIEDCNKYSIGDKVQLNIGI